MATPYMLVVTGRPGSGKTTFAQQLGAELFMPVISRDQVKEGYVHTFGKRHAELPEDTNKIVTDIFFDLLMHLLTNHVSLIAEAAFQHSLWSAKLAQFKGVARITMIICTVDAQVALHRFVARGFDNPLREYFHGDKGVDLARQGIELQVGPYDEPRLDAPTIHVDTTAAYHPSIEALRTRIPGLADMS